jgi:hypothetical protein
MFSQGLLFSTQEAILMAAGQWVPERDTHHWLSLTFLF